MSDKTGVELLEEILFRLSSIEKKIDILDNNVKIIINNVNNSKQPSVSADLDKEFSPKKSVPQAGFKNFRFEQADNMQSTSAKGIMVRGRMIANVGGKQTLLPDVTVKIFNDKDVLIKETKTNRAGFWLSQLPPGRYVAFFDGQFNGQKLVPQNRNFIVPEKLPEGQSDIEVI